jgi:DNA-directed RNA polymerase subunit RPC12/RpoP
VLKKIAVNEDGTPLVEGVACPNCAVRMSRRFLKKPDIDTGLVEEIYRCPICGTTTSRWVEERR